MSAVKYRNYKAVRSLLIAGAEKNLKPLSGRFADQDIQPNPLIADLLKDSNPSTHCDLRFFNVAEEGQGFKFRDGNPNAVNFRGETALFVASKCNEYDWISKIWHAASQQCDTKAGKNYINVLFL